MPWTYKRMLLTGLPNLGQTRSQLQLGPWHDWAPQEACPAILSAICTGSWNGTAPSLWHEPHFHVHSVPATFC